MLDAPVVVGCGTIGSCLAIELSKRKLISELTLCDFDYVTDCFPFISEESGLSKIDVVSFLCRLQNPNLRIIKRKIKVLSPMSGFVIDCRDNKQPDIKPKLRISLDGYLLYIDCTKKTESGLDYHSYIFPKNEKYIRSSINIVINILISESYQYQDFRLYDLRDNRNILLRREPFDSYRSGAEKDN